MLKSALTAADMTGLKMNVPVACRDEIIGMLPSMTSPTVSTLHDKNWLSVETIIKESQARDLIPKLLKAGAKGIIEYPLKKVLN
jgi:ATP phosphoribosyltransferase